MGIGTSGVEDIMLTYVDTVGKNEKKIQEYIQKQLQEDMLADQISINEYYDPFTGEPVKKGK